MVCRDDTLVFRLRNIMFVWSLFFVFVSRSFTVEGRIYIYIFACNSKIILFLSLLFFSFGLLLEDFCLISNDGLWRKKKEKEKCWFLI